MKDERKKLKLIILQCIAVITANFITIWYFEELFFRGFWYVIFASFIFTFIYIIRSFCCLRKIRVFWFAAIPVFLFGIYLAFLFNDASLNKNARYIPNRKTGIAANQNTRIFLKQQKLRMIYIKVKINDAKITYQNPLKKSSSKYQIVIKFAVITAMHCNIINFNFFLSSFIPDSPAKYQFLYSAIITTLIL